MHRVGGQLVVVHDDPAGPLKPTLQDVLALLRQSEVLLMAECKAIPRSYPGLLPAVVAALREFDRIDRSYLLSFDHPLVREAKRAEPRLRTCALSSIRLHEPGPYVRSLGADACALSRDAVGLRSATGDLESHPLESCRAAGIPLWIYTVNEPSEMDRLIGAGISGIFTDYPDRLSRRLPRRLA